MTDSPLRSRSSYIPPAGVDPLRPNGDLFFEGDLVRATLPETADVRRGLASAFASAASGHHSGVALKAEAAGDAALEQQAVRQADLADRQAGLYAPRVSSLRDVKSIGDVGSFIAGAAPGVVADTLPAVAAALITRGRGRLAAPSALAGAAVPSYHQQFGEMAREQRLDPTLSEASAEDRLRSARLGAAGGTLLEALLPAKLANSALRRPARGFLNHMRRDAETEGLTETAQTGIQQFAHNTVDPTRGYDGWEMLDAGVAGAAGGAGLAGATRAPSHVVNALLDRTRPVAEPLAPAPVAPAAPGQFEEILNSAKERFGPQVEEAYGTAKDYVSAFAERANEAVKTAQNPGDFVRQVFSPSAEEQAQSILQPEHEDPTVLNAADPAAGLDDRDARNATSAADLASQLMDDPATPQFIRDKIDSMGGDYSSKVNQAYVASTLLGVKGGKKIVDAVGDFVAFSKELAGKAGTIAEDIKTGVTDKVSKKNLQDIHESDVQPLVNLLAKKLGPTGGAQAPQLAKQLVAAANRLSPNGQINEAVDRRLRNFSEAIDDETLDMVTELSGSDALRASIAKIRAIPSAMSDVRQAGGNSFLESLITVDEARQHLPRIAEAVDELALAGAESSPARESMLNGLAAGVFGSVENAQTVVEYYGNMRRSAYKLEAEQAKVRDDQVAEVTEKFSDQLESVDAIEDPNYEGDDTAASKAEWGALTEGDGPKTQYGFREGKSKRPFRKFVGEDMSSGKNRREAVRAVVDSRGREDMNYGFVDYSDYLAENNITPEQGVKERKRDIEGLIKGHLARKGEDRSSSINALKGELELLERAVADHGAKGALNKLYEVTSRAERGDEDLSASDDDLRAMKTKVRLNTQGMTKYQKQVATEKHNRTLLTFSDADGKYMTLSAPSMVATLGSKRGKTGKVVESSDQKDRDTLKDAVASVIARGYTLVSDLNEVALAPDGPATFAGRTEERRSLVMNQGGKRVADATRGWGEEHLKRLEAAIDRAGDPTDTGYLGLLKEKTYRVMREIEQTAKNDVDYRTETRRVKEKALERWRANEMPDKGALWHTYVGTRAAFDIATDAAQISTATKYSAMSLMREARNAGESLERSGSTVEDRSGGIDRGQENRRLERQRADLEAELNDAISADDLLLQTRARARLEQNAKALAKLQKQDAKESAQSGAGRLLEEKAPKTRVPDVSLASKPQPSSLRTDAVLAANPELLTVLDGYGEPKDAKWSETAIRERVFNAYRKLPDTALKTRLESLRKQYREAAASKNRGAQQEATTLRYIGELINNVIASRATRKTKASSADEALAAQYADRLNEDFSNEAAVEDSTDRMTEGGPARVILPNTSPYTAKDQAKSDKANKFIGRGAPGSSTAAYAKAWGDRANTGEYAKNDTVFISVNGNRPGAITPPWAEIKKATSAGATLITDNPSDRARPFNTGERAVAEFLDTNGYVEKSPGTWVRGYDIDNATGAKRFAPLGKQSSQSDLAHGNDAMARIAALPDTVERVVDGTRVLYVRDADATKYIAGTRGGVVYVNMGKLRADGLVKYLTEGASAAQKQAVLDRLGITAQSLDAVLGNDKRRAAFLRDHELSHIRNGDEAAYPRDVDGKPDLMHPDAIAIEGRAIRDALSKEELATLGVGMRQNRQTTIGDAKEPPKGKDRFELEKKLRAEIRRIRGDEVRLRFDRLIKDLRDPTDPNSKGASGEFSMNADKTDRMIEIALNAADPMGVAWHESLHDFFAMLGEDKAGRSIKRDLVNAANAPQVKKRLRELLKDHPEARKQIEDSPEERVAYMYQFWAAGDPKLRVGPLGTGTFEKIRAFFRDLFRLVGRHERAQDLMAALHEGKFADTRVAAEVLADMPRETINNRMERYAPALKDTMGKLVQTAPDRLRDFQNEHISSLADRMEKFIQRRNQRDGEWTNKRAGILDGTTATQRRAALENMQAMKPPSSPLEHKLAKFFKDMHGYMTDAGVMTLDSKTKQWVPLREVTNYFPRVFDRAALEKDPDGFVKLLMQHGNMTEASARNTLKALTHGTGQIELAENEHALGFSPYAQAVQDRQLTFIDPSNAAEFAKYQSKDLPDITASYVKQAVHRAEYARDFGNRGEEIAKVVAQSGVTDKKDLENINKIVMGLEGTLGYQMSSQTKELFSGILALQNLVILPLAIFSQVVDPIVLAARSGDLRDAGNAYVTALKKLTRQADVDGEDIAEMLGIISQDTVLEAMGVAYGTTHMSKRMRNINRVFFKYNGMQGWNNAMRIAATAAGERYLLQNKDNPAALKELGLEPSDIKTKVSFMGKPNAQNKVVGKERLDVSDPKVKEAMFKFVDQAVLRPSAANRPVWMSDPKFLLVAHLKQFTFAMHNVVLKRANAQLDDGNPKPWLILALAMPTILAADMAKFALTGGPPPGWTFMDFLGHAVERSGLLGLGDFGAQATQGVGQGKMPGEALLGPSFEHLMELLRFLLGAPGVDSTGVIDRTVPGARFV